MIPTSKRAESMARHPSARPVLFDGETAQPALGWHDSYERDRWLLTSRDPWPDCDRCCCQDPPDASCEASHATCADDLERAVHELQERATFGTPDLSSHLDGGYIATELVMIVLAVVLVIIACAVPAINNILVSTSWKGQTAALAMVVGVIVIFSRVGRIVKRARGEC